MSWQRLPVRRLFRVVNGGTPTADPANWDGDIPWATPVDLAKVNGGMLVGTERTLTAIGLATGSRAVPEGSLIVSTRAPIGYVAETSVRMAFNQGCRGLTPTVALDSRYFLYQFLSLASRLNAEGQGSTFAELSGDALATINTVVPPLRQQRAIAAYLDAETARVDALIAKKRQLVLAFRERSAAILLHSTLKGWSSEHRVPVRRVIERVMEPARPDDVILTAYRDGQVTSRESRRLEGYTLAEDESGYQHVSKGDLVFHGLDGFAGAVGVAEVDGKCSPVYHVCSARDSHSALFLAYQLRALSLAGYVELQASSVRQRAIDLRNWERFSSLEVVVPTVDKQIQACQEIAEAQRLGDNACDRITRQVSLLQEHRQALITAAVTGALPIPGALA